MENKSVVNTKEREINLKVLFAHILSMWRKILVFSLIFGILAAGLKGYKIKKASESITIAKIEEKKSLETEISNTNDQIKSLNDYITNSVLANIDPYEETYTTTTISIITDGSNDLSKILETSNRGNQVVQAYKTYVDDTIDFSNLASSHNISLKYLKELITTKSDLDADTITVRVVGNDATFTKEIMNFILQKINLEEINMKSLYGEYTQSNSEVVTDTGIDAELIAKPYKNTTILPPSSNCVMADSIERKNGLESTLSSDTKTLEALPSTEVLPVTQLSLEIVIYGLIGFFGGVVLMILLYAIKFSLSGIIYSEEDVKNLYGIKTLTVLPMKMAPNRNQKFDKIAYCQMDSSYGYENDLCIEKALTNIIGLSGGKKSVLVIGTGLKQNLAEIKDKIENQNHELVISVSTNINENSSELQKLGEADEVILAVERNETKINDLSKTVETVYDWQKTIIGSIII